MVVKSDIIPGMPFEWIEPGEKMIDMEKAWIERHPRLAAKRLLELKARLDGLERAIRQRLADVNDCYEDDLK